MYFFLVSLMLENVPTFLLTLVHFSFPSEDFKVCEHEWNLWTASLVCLYFFIVLTGFGREWK